MSRKPNILLLMSDQHRFDVSGFYGNDIVRTPNLDRLAKDAVVMDNCYTPSPICIPARQSMASGKLPWGCGCRTYGEDLEAGTMTFARKFSQYAYNTICCGKLHHYGQDQNQGWTMRVGYDNFISDRNIEGFHSEELEKYKPAENQWWPWGKEIKRAGVGKSPYMSRDEISIAGAKQFIREQFVSPYYDCPSQRPVLLKVSLHSPHYPYFIDEERFSYYLNRVKAFYKEKTMEHPVVTQDWERIPDDVTEREAIRATAAYYGMIEAVDAMFGEVVDALEAAGQDLDDWIIMYASDHGDLIGEHGLWMKYKYYEASAKVPFFIRYPKKFKAGRCDANVNLCDLYATLCDLADIPCPEGLDSRSFVPVLSGDRSNWDDTTISQLDDTCMIKTGHLKYQYTGKEHSEILFNLKEDPKELQNCIDDPAYAEQLKVFRERLHSLDGFRG